LLLSVPPNLISSHFIPFSVLPFHAMRYFIRGQDVFFIPQRLSCSPTFNTKNRPPLVDPPHRPDKSAPRLCLAAPFSFFSLKIFSLQTFPAQPSNLPSQDVDIPPLSPRKTVCFTYKFFWFFCPRALCFQVPFFKNIPPSKCALPPLKLVRPGLPPLSWTQFLINESFLSSYPPPHQPRPNLGGRLEQIIRLTPPSKVGKISSPHHTRLF